MARKKERACQEPCHSNLSSSFRSSSFSLFLGLCSIRSNKTEGRPTQSALKLPIFHLHWTLLASLQQLAQQIFKISRSACYNSGATGVFHCECRRLIDTRWQGFWCGNKDKNPSSSAGLEAKGSDGPMDANHGVVRVLTEVRTARWWNLTEFKIKEGEYAGSLEGDRCCPIGI